MDPHGNHAVVFDYFRRRSPVIFSSSDRFWDTHGFVQQSLALSLARAGIPVHWLDGAGWRRYQPTVPADSGVDVRQLVALPGRRFLPVDKATVILQYRQLQKIMGKGHKPFFWVHGGIDERLASAIPPDVFSVFDDPYSFSLHGSLVSKARLILVQNSLTQRLFFNNGDAAGKTKLVYPPIAFDNVNYQDGVFEPPAAFPSQIMGYIGSFFGSGFDFAMLEEFCRRLPDWGFVLQGRTDAEGEEKLKAFAGFKNFLRLAPVPRGQTAPLWRKLSATLLLYPRFAAQDGAFATKAIESFFFGVPCVGTEVPKTEDLGPTVARADHADKLIALALEATKIDRTLLRAEFDRLAADTEPMEYLARVVRWLS